LRALVGVALLLLEGVRTSLAAKLGLSVHTCTGLSADGCPTRAKGMLVAATEGASVPSNPGTDFAVDGAAVLIARLSVGERRAYVATVGSMRGDGTGTALGALATRQGASGPA